jgi:superkiller protein 3
LFSWAQERLAEFPADDVFDLLQSKSEIGVDFDAFKNIDDVGSQALMSLNSEQEPMLVKALRSSILAQKRAIASCAHDKHAQAVAWYNLGWTEYRAHVCLEQEGDSDGRITTYLRAAMKCFHRAIGLEASNSEFWNSLGVITTTLNPR